MSRQHGVIMLASVRCSFRSVHSAAARVPRAAVPLAGVSDRVFRGLVRRWAPNALLFTEMVNATSLELGHGLCKVESLAGGRGPSACSCSITAPRPWLMQHDGLKPVGPF